MAMQVSGAKTEVFSETQLDRKMRDERVRWPMVGEDTPSEAFCACVQRRHLAHVMRTAGLTRLERRVFIFRVHGATLRQVADVLGLSRQRLCRLSAGIRKKLACARADRYHGLHEVYWQEVRRHIYRKPGHAGRRAR